MSINMYFVLGAILRILRAFSQLDLTIASEEVEKYLLTSLRGKQEWVKTASEISESP
jgi:hypothetical protein